METVRFQIEVVTPLFMAGASQTGPPELRAASLKGLLRFWYRAIYPNDVAGEEEVFGALGARSPVSLAVAPIRPLVGQARSPDLSKYSYLGYGLIAHHKPSKKFLTTRPYFQPGSTFAITLTFAPGLPAAAKEKVLRAFWALAMLGGLGARNRRGFGAFYVTSGSPPAGLTFNPQDEKVFIQAVKSLVAGIDKVAGVPEYSCFSNRSVVLVGAALANGKKVLEGFNTLFQRHRSYYEEFPNKPKTSGIPKNDHDLMQQFLTNSTFTPSAAPARAAFGLPHNYFFRSSRQKGFVDFMEGDIKGRRASPLFFHVQKLASGKACGVVTFLPARFLPSGQRITLSTENMRAVQVSPPNYAAITAFLSELLKKGAQKVV